MLKTAAIGALADNEHVAARSDWGVDTLITYAISASGLDLYEHNLREGKRHALYGGLNDIRQMVLECLDAVASLSNLEGDGLGEKFGSDPPAPVPEDLKHTVAYDIDKTIPLLAADWSPQELDLLDQFGARIATEMEKNRVSPNFAFMDAGELGNRTGCAPIRVPAGRPGLGQPGVRSG